MADLRTAQIIEHFHLAFLQVLAGRLPQSSYVLKGGANLRYFFASFRCSEDIDLDAGGIEPSALTDRVDGVLASAALTALLRTGALSVGEVTKPKQTETTQVLALAGRSDTQARDVFDLELLLRTHQPADDALTAEVHEKAAEHAASLPFSAFQDQVLPFLAAEIAELNDTLEAWDQVQTFVVSRLLKEQA